MPTITRESSVSATVEGGRYERLLCLGRGAWGVVYLARDRVIGRTVALKVIEFSPSLADEVRCEMAARSEREARAAGSLNHPNIVTIHDAGPGVDNGSFFIVMEYVEGDTLANRLREGPVQTGEAVRIGRDIASALEYAHCLGVVHRDVKPANILIRNDGTPKIADFGVARLESSDLTSTGQWVGSPAYMSPEQARGQPADPRSDIFALGVVLYEMVTGTRPFSAETLAGLSYQIIHEDPEPPTRRRPCLDPRWDPLILKAMAKNPEERHPTAGDLADDLESLGAATGCAPAPVRGKVASPPGAVTGTLDLEILSAGSGRPGRIPPRQGGRIPWRRIAATAAVIAALVAAVLGLRSIAPAPVEMATLRLNVVHGLDSGEVKVGVDGRPVWVQSIRAPEEQTRLSGFSRWLRRSSDGRATGVVKIPAGDQRITVSVISEQGRWTQTTSRRLDPGTTETLDIKVRSGRTTGMELKWKR